MDFNQFTEKVKRPVMKGVSLTLANDEMMESMLCVTAFHCIFSTRKTVEDELEHCKNSEAMRYY